MLSHVKGLIASSREVMSRHYSQWDENDDTFRAKRRPDKEDRDAVRRGQPKKMIVPLTTSQILTFVAFNVMVVTQNKRFFELEPTGTEDNPLREPIELILERDLRRNTWQTFLVQFFLDIGRFGLGVAEVGWVESYRKMRVQETAEVAGPFGTTVPETSDSYVDIPTFVGNRVFPLSPYRFYPDTSLPLSRYQEGEFCGSEDMFSFSRLASDSSLFNVDKIPKFTEAAYVERQKSSRMDAMPFRKASAGGLGAHDTGSDDSYVSSGPVAVSKICFDLNPSKFKIEGKENVVGDEDFNVRFCCHYANDATILKFEEAYYLHGQFPYICSQFLPDQHQKLNEGLSEQCEQISSLITWLINAHVTSQRQMIKGKWIVDPAGIDVKTLDSDSPYIFMKRGASQTGVDRYIQQFQSADPTGAFMTDASSLKGLLAEVTGYNETMHGQYSSGRRSATQDRVVAQAGAARGKGILGGIWDTAFEPLARQLVTNNRQEMTWEQFSLVLGSAATPELFSAFKADPVALASSEDFFVFDGSTPSEKAFLAQSLQEIFMMLLQNPQVSAVLGFGPEILSSLFKDIYNLRGVTPSRLPVPNPQAAAMLAQPNVVPLPSVAS